MKLTFPAFISLLCLHIWWLLIETGIEVYLPLLRKAPAPAPGWPQSTFLWLLSRWVASCHFLLQTSLLLLSDAEKVISISILSLKVINWLASIYIQFSIKCKRSGVAKLLDLSIGQPIHLTFPASERALFTPGRFFKEWGWGDLVFISPLVQENEYLPLSFKSWLPCRPGGVAGVRQIHWLDFCFWLSLCIIGFWRYEMQHKDL